MSPKKVRGKFFLEDKIFIKIHLQQNSRLIRQKNDHDMLFYKILNVLKVSFIGFAKQLCLELEDKLILK